MFVPYVFPALLSYILGSFPFGLIIHALLEAEEKDTPIVFGQSNLAPLALIRIGKKRRAIIIAMLEITKPLLAYGVFYAYTKNPEIAVIAAFTAALGQVHPVFLKFKKHISPLPMLGLCFALSLNAGFILSAFWLMFIGLTKRPKTTTVYTCLLAPLAIFSFTPATNNAAFMLTISTLILLHSRSTLFSLFPNREPRINW